MGRRTLLLITSVLLAAIGTALIAVYVKGADQRATRNAALVQVLVLTSDVDAGEPVGATGFESVPEAQARGAVTTYAQLAAYGGYAKSQLYKGTVLRPVMLTRNQGTATGTTTAGINGLGFTVDVQVPDRAAGLLVPKASANLYAADKTGKVTTLLSGVRVLAVGANSALKTASQDTVPTTTVALDVPDKKITAIMSAEALGDRLFIAVIGTSSSPTTTPTPASLPAPTP